MPECCLCPHVTSTRPVSAPSPAGLASILLRLTILVAVELYSHQFGFIFRVMRTEFVSDRGAVNCYWASPAQSFFVSGSVGTRDRAFENGISTSVKGGSRHNFLCSG
jgi:hypothetical protein